VPADQLYKVAYDEAVRALSEQQATIESFRARAGLFLLVRPITTSFLGAQALHGGGSGLFSWLGLAGFAGVAGASLAILWPRKWQIATNPSNVIATYIEATEPISIEEMHRELSLHMRGSWAENRKDEAKLVVLFQSASVLLAVELVLWVIAIATNA
jgi:hypothetical protein